MLSFGPKADIRTTTIPHKVTYPGDVRVPRVRKVVIGSPVQLPSRYKSSMNPPLRLGTSEPQRAQLCPRSGVQDAFAFYGGIEATAVQLSRGLSRNSWSHAFQLERLSPKRLQVWYLNLGW